MAEGTKRWLVGGAAALALAVIAGLVMLGGGSGDDEPTESPIEEPTAAATAPADDDSEMEEVIVSGIRARLERALELGDQADIAESLRPITAAFRATDHCQSGSSSFEIDLDLELLSLEGDLLRTATQQAPSQTTTGVLDLDTGAFVWIGSGTGYEEIYFGLAIPLEEDEDADPLPVRIAFIGVSAFSAPTFTGPLGEPDALVDTVSETFNPYSDDIDELMAGLRAAAIALPPGTPPADAAATLTEDGTLGAAAQALADVLAPEALPAPIGESVQQSGACALGVVGVAPAR